MATGITKREQHSQDAYTVSELFREPLPLPDNGAGFELAYPNKATDEEILCAEPRRFLKLTGNAAQETSIGSGMFILDDNYFVLNQMVADGNKANLFYLDPPYGTGLDFQSRDLKHAYKDSMGQAAYLEFMRRRLILMREAMASDGSIYVHIGHHMLGHLKVLMDEIFGADNFRNIITRRKCSSKNFTKKQYANINDYILFYSKGRSYKWNQPGVEPEQAWIEKEYPKIDSIGRRYKLVPIHAPGTRRGETGQPWRGMMPPPGKHWQYAPSKLEELDFQGDIHWSRNGNPRRKVYWSADKKTALTDYWDQFRDAHHQSIQITGYPTEKNLSMLKMLVEASSDPGDLVMDPFCGSGTTLHAARDLGREFIGVDASFAAARATLVRMRHGLNPMGDYVKKKESDVVQLALVEEEHTVAQQCAFVVDGRLLAAFENELLEISGV